MPKKLKYLSVNSQRAAFLNSQLEKTRTVQVWGLGTFGGNLSLIKYLCKQGYLINLYELKSKEDLKESWDKLLKFHDSIRVTWNCSHPKVLPNQLLFISPAVKPNHSCLLNIPSELISTEIELSLCLLAAIKKNVHVIIGSVGKSTCASLLAKALETKVYGNIGNSILESLTNIPDNYIVELSSFQLHYLRLLEFIPTSYLCTPIKNNHAEWHGGINEYILAKQQPLSFWKKNGTIGFDMNNEDLSERTSLNLKIKGNHNLNNARAVVDLLKRLDLMNEKAKGNIENFPGLKHRFEIVIENQGLCFINDSKATSPEATLSALESVNNNCILFLQGVPLDGCEDKLLKIINEKCHTLVLVSSMQKLFSKGINNVQIERFNTLTEAFKSIRWFSFSKAEILLSPSAPSYDQFKNYEERGELFSQLAKGLSHTL